MMRKYFPLEASERLFVAIEEDDVVDAQVSLPPTIALSCTTEIIHDNYALCLQFWLNGVDRQELLRLVRKQAKGDELTADERKQFKYMRARYKHLRFAQRLYLKKHQAGFLFGKTTVFLGRFQDGFRNGKKNIVSYYGNLLRIYLSSPVWSLVNYSLRHSQLESVSSFIAYRQKQMHTLKEIIAKPRLTGREFHDVRKIISQQVSYYDTLRSLDPENKEALQIADRGENIQVWIEPVVFNDLLKWLNALDEKYALRVTQIDVSAAEKPGMVNVQRLEFGRG
ncbi:TPA: type II secretion system protein GspM [Escherichia coli]|uniref:type II secretion system protein GspM n=3 Tax=Escherichia coli TaxID=562 RepID=UPI000854EB4E|nr:type II secretion system protein GspM [Escherichia coli]OEN05348.1 hypothetical protein BHF38_04365 [Escherichia coli]